jgi:Tfp pilus assembly ATPase PilU
MQCFDDELEKMVRNGSITKETALGYATNQGNLLLALSEMSSVGAIEAAPAKPKAESLQDELLEITSTPYSAR